MKLKEETVNVTLGVIVLIVIAQVIAFACLLKMAMPYLVEASTGSPGYWLWAAFLLMVCLAIVKATILTIFIKGFRGGISWK